MIREEKCSKFRWSRSQSHQKKLIIKLNYQSNLFNQLALLSNKKIFISLLLFGILIRFVLIPISFDPDLTTFFSGGVSLFEGNAPYTYIFVYPPGWLFTMTGIVSLSELFPFVNHIFYSNSFILLLNNITYGMESPKFVSYPAVIIEKTFLLIFDLIASYGISLIILEKKNNIELSRLSFLLWFLSPIILVESSIHGAYDIIPTTFTIFGIYALQKNKPFYGGMLLGLGIVFKIYPIFILLIVIPILYNMSNKFLKTILSSLLGGVIVIIIVTLPLILTHSLETYLTLLTNGARISTSFGGFNIFSVITITNSSYINGFLFYNSGIINRINTYAIYAIILIIPFIIIRYKINDFFSERGLYLLFLLLILVGFSFNTTQAQYLVWFLPFMLLYSIIYNRSLLFYILISTLPAIFYTFFLAGPYFLFQPLIYQFNIGNATFAVSNIKFWFDYGHYFSSIIFSIVVLLEFFILISYFVKNFKLEVGENNF